MQLQTLHIVQASGCEFRDLSLLVLNAESSCASTESPMLRFAEQGPPLQSGAVRDHRKGCV